MLERPLTGKQLIADEASPGVMADNDKDLNRILTMRCKSGSRQPRPITYGKKVVEIRIDAEIEGAANRFDPGIRQERFFLI